MCEQKVSRKELEEARHREYGVYGYFNAYCYLHSDCASCNRWVRQLCKLKAAIERWQQKIILRICKEGGVGNG